MQSSTRTILTNGSNADLIRTTVDLIFPSSAPLEIVLQGLNASYRTCVLSLTDFLQFARSCLSPGSERSDLLAHGLPGSINDDVWSLDTRGVFTLAVRKQTYESLGIVGARLPWKECRDIHVIRLFIGNDRSAMGDMTDWPTLGAKELAALQSWDARRGSWKIVYHLRSLVDSGEESLLTDSVDHEVEKSIRKMHNVYIPHLQQNLVEENSSCDGIEDREEAISAVFEWVGMASLGSQRLSVTDWCDPYIAVYTPPEPFHVGELTVIRWTGFITPTFLQNLFDIILSPNVPLSNFVSVTAHSVLTSPVTYVPADKLKRPPLRMPGPDSEDTMSLLYVREDDGTSPEQAVWWVLAESIGRWDKRLG